MSSSARVRRYSGGKRTVWPLQRWAWEEVVRAWESEEGEEEWLQEPETSRDREEREGWIGASSKPRREERDRSLVLTTR